MSSVLVDADACPVKWDVLDVCRRFDVKPHFFSHQPIKRLMSREDCEFIYCESGPDSVDDAMVECLRSGDLVVTVDLLLSKRVLELGGRVINFMGKRVTCDTIGMDLGRREINYLAEQLGEKERSRGAKPKKGNFKGLFHNTCQNLFSQGKKG